MEEFDSEAFNVDVAPAEVFQEQVRIGNLFFGKMVVTEVVFTAHDLRN